MSWKIFIYFQPAPPKREKYVNENKWSQENFTVVKKLFFILKVTSLKKILSMCNCTFVDSEPAEASWELSH